MIYYYGVSMIQKLEGMNAHHSVDCNHLAENDADNEQHSVTSVHGAYIKTTHLIRFFVLILGVLTPPPSIDAPVKNIPLQNNVNATKQERNHTNSPSCSKNTQAYAKSNSE